MRRARVVAGTVTALDGTTATIALDTDPETGEVATITATLPALTVGGVAHALIGPHGAVVLGGGGGAPFTLRFDTYAELRDGITVAPMEGLTDALDT